MNAPTSTPLRLPIFVTAMVCTFSVRVVEPTPVPHKPAKTPEIPSKPIPRLRTPAVGGLEATNRDDAWYDPTYIRAQTVRETLKTIKFTSSNHTCLKKIHHKTSIEKQEN